MTVQVNATDPEGATLVNLVDWQVNGTPDNLLIMPLEAPSDNSETTDYSTFSNNGTVNGALFKPTRGIERGAYQFDGTSNYIQMGTTISSQIATGPFSIEAWALAEDLSGADSGFGMGIIKSHGFFVELIAVAIRSRYVYLAVGVLG